MAIREVYRHRATIRAPPHKITIVRILLTNDDGIDAPGLAALHDVVADLGEVHVVAPANVQSATSHAVTFHRPVCTWPHTVEPDADVTHGFTGTAVDGRPADCVKLGLEHLVPAPIDLVLSGMNAGANVGINVVYSGTVAAAREAAFIGIPAIAVSLHIGRRDVIPWQAAARHARRAIDQVLAGPMQAHTVLNLNVPILDDGATPRGVKVVPVSTSPVVNDYEARDQADGTRHFAIRNSLAFHEREPATDVDALYDRWMTLTPLHFDPTDHEQVVRWRHHLTATRE